ncbi:MIP18 family protein galla-2 [Belonocnema kinseyi]|uniref:MIP18 family protein galla-2 n=1 Tax=Belonocnema kinseyi TaxID=2817044 RepID=UPI00143CEBAD|nr:MIP18 family protein galla-2 [Belonocnema kinseyi]
MDKYNYLDESNAEKLENVNPKLYKKADERQVTADDENEDVVDEFDSREVFDIVRNINDPEHPLTLEELKVVEEELIEVDNEKNNIVIKFTPTIPHCSMATLIGLSIRVLLLRTLPARFKITVEITPGSHTSEDAINKQLADKERVAAALENNHLLEVINQCIRIKD